MFSGRAGSFSCRGEPTLGVRGLLKLAIFDNLSLWYPGCIRSV